MNNKIKRKISALMAFVMLLSVMLSGMNTAVYAAGAKIDVWDFGCVTGGDTSLYDYHITTDLINGLESLAVSGKFKTAGEVDFGGGLIINTNSNDRMYCLDPACTKNYGTNAKAQASYSDGYTANGMWYANGTGGENRRYAQISGVNAGDEIVVYTGASNTGDLNAHFTCIEGGTQEEIAFVPSGEMHKLSFVAECTGTYKLWYDTSVTGKPVINRIVRYPSVAILGTLTDVPADVSLSGSSIKLTNTTTYDEFYADVDPDTATFTANVTPGYTYSLTLRGVTGYGLTYATKFTEVPYSAVATGVTASYSVEPKQTYDLSGTIEGFDSSYDLSKLAITLTPDSNDTDTVRLATGSASFSATLDPDVVYTVSLEGVNDYEITSGGAFMFSGVKTAEHKVEVDTKATYNVTGSFVTSDGSVPATGDITALVFTNLEDEYTYSASVAGDEYSVSLRDGDYIASVSSEKYKTSTHVVVKGGAVSRDLYLKTTVVAPPAVDTSVRDIYVGCEGKVNNFETVGEAFAAAAVMNPTSEAERVTIHIAPGTYREQTSLNTPYVSLVKEGEGEVVLTWYYGIGYKYYSADATGYWSDEADYDKYEKNAPAKWGVSTYIKSGAKYFKAEDITFETSFNKYITDEEIFDGVESDGSIAFKRTLGASVTSKAATERASAIAIEADGVEFKDCKFIGSQDTLYMGAPVRVYYNNCLIEGNTDYIFGSGNAVFDACELRFAGYTDTAMGGYITAARADADKWTGAEVTYAGYLFRNCVITRLDKDIDGNEMLHDSGYFGRPWDPNAAVAFSNTVLEDITAINAAGWTSMSGNDPANASYKEYNTLYNGTAVDTASRVTGVVDAAALPTVSALYGSWTPTYLPTEDTAVAFATVPYFSSDVDVLLPASGDTLTVKYSLGADDANDASRIDWYRVAEDGTETLIKTSSTAASKGATYTLQKADEGSFIKAVVTPVTYSGATADAQSTITVKTVDKGSGSGGVHTDRPSGKVAIFLAGDSTVKDYSAGALNNKETRTEGSWGEFLEEFVSSDYVVRNYAEGGRSSRTFIDGTKDDGSDKFFDKIKSEMMAGDYLFIQFGHNDSSASYADRYVPVGTPDENGVFPVTAPTAEGAGDGTFKYYLQEMVNAAKEVGATPVMVTPVARMYFDSEGKITSHHGSNDEYVIATKQVAQENGIQCIDLYAYTKDLYEKAYADSGNSKDAAALFAKGEKTHHSKVGGFAIATELAQQLQSNTAIGLTNAIVAPKSTSSLNGNGEIEFSVWSDGSFQAYAIGSDGNYTTDIDTYWTEYISNQLKAIAEGPQVVVSPWGNVDGNDILTANDASAVLQYSLDKTVFDNLVEYDFTYADVDADGQISAQDASNIYQKVLDGSIVFKAESMSA